MRHDMSKVIVERPRIGGKLARKGRQVEDDLQVSHEGMRAPYVRHYNNKELNENLAPLLRFLDSRVGRRWDDVYSEICKNIRPDSTVQQHVLVHVKQFVNTHVRRNGDGELWDYDGRPGPLGRWSRFYVDPDSGILTRNPNRQGWSAQQREYRREKEAERFAIERQLPDGTDVRKHGGIWYAGVRKPVPAPTKRTRIAADGSIKEYLEGGEVYDYLLGVYVRHPQLPRKSWGNAVTATHYYASKRQLSGAELRRHGLEND
jgi:hypothetical protein